MWSRDEEVSCRLHGLQGQVFLRARHLGASRRCDFITDHCWLRKRSSGPARCRRNGSRMFATKLRLPAWLSISSSGANRGPAKAAWEDLGKNWRGGSWMARHETRSRFRRPDVTLSAKTFYPTTPFSSRDSTVKNRFKQEIFAGRSLV